VGACCNKRILLEKARGRSCDETDVFMEGKARVSVLILELACKHPCCTKLKREGVGWTVPVLTPHLLLFLQKKNAVSLR